jgi:amino acid adenylation domain-containing protein
MSEGIDRYLAEAARRWPDQTAVRCGSDALTYSELRDRAAALAARLSELGVRPGDRVAIAMTKGIEMPVAVQAIWMAGAAFVPFDMFSPLARLKGLVQACDISVAITATRNAKVAAGLAEGTGLSLLDAAETEDPGVPPDFTPADNRADDLAYIMFTSGSTGQPKGIMHTHASGSAFAEMWARLYGPTVDDVLFCTVPLHFDFSLADFFAAAIGGATTELVAEPVQRFPASLGKLLQDSGATIWSTVPFALIQLCEHGAVDRLDLSRLRCIIYGGEALPAAKLQTLRGCLGEVRLSNSYGPAEVNQCTEFTVPPDFPSDKPIPIGHPTDHARLAVDEDGELLVATPAMMRGYWRRPELDAAVFTEIDGERYYRTGDAVRLGADGLWQFVGRADRQVKVRGFRIELDEIEHVLASHPDVEEAAVIVAPDRMSVAAFITGRRAGGPDIEAVQKHAAAMLPAYAVPSKIEVRERFDRNGTGKIDRKALERLLT